MATRLLQPLAWLAEVLNWRTTHRLRSRFLHAAIAATFLACMGLQPVVAGTLPEAQGPVILTISGSIANTTDGEAAHLDMAQIERLGLRDLRTSNPFVSGVHDFSGVLFADLLEYVGAEGSTLVAAALDGYVIEIPIADLKTYPVLLATRKDGKHMRVRQKGPLWVIYPIDQHPELKSERFSGRSIWQLRSINVE